MRFASFIARRYLTRGRRYSFVSVISFVSILGITIGVAALVVALSLINGFQRDIRDRIISSSAHLMITPALNEGIPDYRALAARIRSSLPQATKVAAVAYETVLIRGSGKSSSGAILRGMEFDIPGMDLWLRDLELGRLPQSDDELLIGWDLATKLGLGEGDTCLVIIPQAIASPTGVMPRFKRFHISGIFRSGLYEFDNATAVTRLSAMQALLRLGDTINYIQVNIRRIFEVDECARILRRWLPLPLRIVTWKELNASLYSALRLEKTVLFFTLALIIVVAALNIVAGLFLLVIQKIRDIGILISFGASPAVIRRIFAIQGQVIGWIGTLTGLGLGLLFCALANRFHLIRVPYEIYQITHIRFLVQPLDILAVGAVSMVISIFATRFPSRRASQVSVVEAVKYE